ncbi:KGK domain-containing protein [Microcystis aeruginosa]|uniref:KGK domain protein n=1 Tax=Microcystis aeruginosa Ma_QC_C_20070703_M131 TaxID=2486263 RepID=A0A551X9D5_MICAE|nr:KGK domain-containing protein [Microcystis aeruginosa]MDB9391320.1 KGK domain-containing protein [Microcystis aeruginosa CS-579]TRT45343.1 MAG: KGK domain protein [Microcystis aeruginosa Ma_QC_C_20070703_M131]
MNFDTFNNSQKIIIEDDDSVLMFEDEEVILVRKFREKIQADLLKYIGKYTSSGRLTTDMGDRSSLFGQINKIEWVHYPSEGKDCKLLIRGEKDWRTGKVKTYGECTFSSVLEKLPKKTPERPDYDDEFLRELQKQGFEHFNETRQIKITLEFIPENSPLEPESPLEEIRQMLRENSEKTNFNS